MYKISVTTQDVPFSSTQAFDTDEYQTNTYEQKHVSINTCGNNIITKATDYRASEIISQKSIAREEFRKINNLLKGISTV